MKDTWTMEYDPDEGMWCVTDGESFYDGDTHYWTVTKEDAARLARILNGWTEV